MEKISVIIPVYNVEKYLSQCLESVIYQSFSNLEIILVDDCGNDNSLKIAQEYKNKDKRIILLHHKKNLELAAARNTGLKNATGDFIFFLDSDDYLDADALKNAYLEIKESNSDIVITKTIPFKDEDVSKSLNERLKDMEEWFESKTQEYFKITKENFEYAISNFPTVSWGKLFNSSFLKENNLFFVNKNIVHEDKGFFIKFMSRLPKIATIESVGVYYRLRKESLTYEIYNNKTHKRKINLRISIQDALNYIKSNSSKEDKKIFYDSIYGVYDCYELFCDSCSFLYKKIWFKNSKKIKILGISVFKQKISRNKKITKILGIPLTK